VSSFHISSVSDSGQTAVDDNELVADEIGASVKGIFVGTLRKRSAREVAQAANEHVSPFLLIALHNIYI